MTDEIQTRSGSCATHGSVEATRQIPRMQFPFLFWAVRRWLARRQPFRYPECGMPIQTG